MQKTRKKRQTDRHAQKMTSYVHQRVFLQNKQQTRERLVFETIPMMEPIRKAYFRNQTLITAKIQ